MQRSMFQVLPTLTFLASFCAASYILFTAGFVIIEGSHVGYHEVGPWFSLGFVAGNLLLATLLSSELAKKVRSRTRLKVAAPPSPFENVLPREEPSVGDIIGRSA